MPFIEYLFASSIAKFYSTFRLSYIFYLDIPGIEGVNIYTYKELKIATDDFSAANKVGEGGFGSVYRVTFLYFKVD